MDRITGGRTNANVERDFLTTMLVTKTFATFFGFVKNSYGLSVCTHRTKLLPVSVLVCLSLIFVLTTRSSEVERNKSFSSQNPYLILQHRNGALKVIVLRADLGVFSPHPEEIRGAQLVHLALVLQIGQPRPERHETHADHDITAHVHLPIVVDPLHEHPHRRRERDLRHGLPDLEALVVHGHPHRPHVVGTPQIDRERATLVPGRIGGAWGE